MTDTLEDLYVLLDSPLYSEIIPGKLYLGTIDAVRDENFISTMNAVVSLCKNEHETTSKKWIGRLLAPGTDHLYIDIEDSSHSDIGQYFAETSAFIASHLAMEGHKVYVHCVSGMSRSPTIVAAYLLSVSPERMVYDVLEELKEKRPIIRPNRGFLEALLKVYGKNNEME